jgi:hypothetical protein
VGNLNAVGQSYNLRIRGLNGEQVVDLTLPIVIMDFTLSAGRDGFDLKAGETGSTLLTLSTLNGFNEEVSLTCSGAPAEAGCTISPPSVQFDGTQPVENAQPELTVKTTARATGAPLPTLQLFPGAFEKGVPVRWFALGLFFLVFLAAWSAACHSRCWGYLGAGGSLVLALFIVLMWLACGGGSKGYTPTPNPNPKPGSSSGTAAGTYTLRVTATSPSLTRSTTINLTVR